MSSYKRYILFIISLFICCNICTAQDFIGECDTESDTSCQFNKIYSNKFSIKDFIKLDEDGKCYPFQDYDKKYNELYDNSIKIIKQSKILQQSDNKDKILQRVIKLNKVIKNNSKESIEYQTAKNLITLIPFMLNRKETIKTLFNDELLDSIDILLLELNKQSIDGKYIELVEKTNIVNETILDITTEYINNCSNDTVCKNIALVHTKTYSNMLQTKDMLYISPDILNKYNCQNNPNTFLCVIVNMHSEVKHDISNTITKFSDSLQNKYFKSVDIVNQLSVLKNNNVRNVMVDATVNLLSYDNELQAISKLGYFANNNFGGRKKSLDEENENIFNTIIKTTSHLSYQARLDKYQTEVKNNIYNHITILDKKIKEAEIYQDNILKDLKKKEQVTKGVANMFDCLIGIVKDINNIIREFFVVEL